MNLNRNCPCCNLPATTKNSETLNKPRQKGDDFLWLNCKKGHSSFIIVARVQRLAIDLNSALLKKAFNQKLNLKEIFQDAIKKELENAKN